MADKKTTVMGGVDSQRIKDLAHQYSLADADKTSASEHMNDIMDLVKDADIHVEAFKKAMALKKKTSLDAQDFMRALEQYCHILGIWSQSDMISPRAVNEAEQPPEQPLVTIDEARELGLASGVAGENETDNPIDPMMAELFEAWAEGWTEGQAELADAMRSVGDPDAIRTEGNAGS